MPSKEFDTVWPAKPHTIAKIAILKAYLKAWFAILGSSKRGQTILYIDGFAGPGEYTNHQEGSPIAAVTVARETIGALGSRWIAGTVHCAFIERDADRCSNLNKRLALLGDHPQVKTTILNDSFVAGMARVRTAMPGSFQCDSPLFVFIDPFGATGAPFAVVGEILGSPCSEVLINLDVDGIGRIKQADEGANAADLLTGIFGDRSWDIAMTSQTDFTRLCREGLDLYLSKLRALPNVRYVFPFEMRNKDNTLNYDLVFASQNPLGLEKMKEAMRSVDRSGGYSFSDGGSGQNNLFRFDNPEDFAVRVHDRFVGKDVPAPALRDFALNETPFPNAKAMLKVLEDRALIAVTSSKPRRRRGDFGDGSFDSVKFLPAKAGPKSEQGALFDG